MKTIEIKEDGKVITTKYLSPLICVSENKIKMDGKWYAISDKPSYRCLDHNGVGFTLDKDVWLVKSNETDHLELISIHAKLWCPIKISDFLPDIEHTDKRQAQVFTTKEAADQFVSDNRPFVTHDGVTVYKGHQLRCMDKSTSAYQGVVEYHKASSLRTDIFLWFSSMDAFNDYIKRHKAVLSLDMIETMLAKHWGSEFPKSSIYQHIIELVNEQFKPQ